VKALHLEIVRTDVAAARLDQTADFVAREKYHLMTRELP
jgi:hypothetical protein